MREPVVILRNDGFGLRALIAGACRFQIRFAHRILIGTRMYALHTLKLLSRILCIRLGGVQVGFGLIDFFRSAAVFQALQALLLHRQLCFGLHQL